MPESLANFSSGVPRSDKYHKPKRADFRYVQGYLVPVLMATVVQKNAIDVDSAKPRLVAAAEEDQAGVGWQMSKASAGRFTPPDL